LLPDGDYEGSDSIDADGIDADEEYTVKLVLRKRGERLEADFSGSSRQARTSINGGALDAKTAIGVGLKMLLDPASEFTSGTFRDIDIVIPPGSIASALPPDGPIFLYWEIESVIMAAILRALSQALGEDAIGGDYGSTNVHNAYGRAPDGTPWACSALAGGENGPWGGSKVGDGDGCSCTYLLNIMSPSTESLEVDFPLTILRREFVPDSAGPGANRGGAAITRDVQWKQPAEHQTIPVRFRHSSGLGVKGGRDGALGGVWIFGKDGAETVGAETLVAIDDDSVYADTTVVAGTMNPTTMAPEEGGRFFYYCETPVWSTETGATWRYLTNGGGGWGDPLERDPERVKRDVRDGYVSVEGAKRDYGVVVIGDPHREPEQLRVDAEATRGLRGAPEAKREELS
jgi:N-methylhydantoinase B